MDKKNLLNITHDQSMNDRTLDPFKLGTSAANLFMGYTLFILEKSLAAQVSKIYFFTREGEFLIKVFDILVQYLKVNQPTITLPEYDVLEVSRLSTFSASLKEISLAEMMRMWNVYSSQSYSSMLKTLNLPLDKFNKFAKKVGLQCDELIKKPWLDSRVISLFEMDEFRELAWEYCQLNKRFLLNYLDEKELSKEKKVAIVDIGWRGTIQDNLALLLPEVHFTGIYLGLQAFLNVQPCNSMKFSFGPNLNQKKEYIHFFDFVTPLEIITNSPNGSVIAYDSHAKPIRRVNEEENSTYYSFASPFQQGVLHIAKEQFKTVSIQNMKSQDFKSAALEIWDFLLSDSFYQCITVIVHDETFGLGGYVVFDKKSPAILDFIKGIFLKEQRKKIIDFIKFNQNNNFYKSELFFIKKIMIVLLIKLSMMYKRFFLKRRRRD